MVGAARPAAEVEVHHTSGIGGAGGDAVWEERAVVELSAVQISRDIGTHVTSGEGRRRCKTAVRAAAGQGREGDEERREEENWESP